MDATSDATAQRALVTTFPAFIQMQTLPPYWTSDAAINVRVIPQTAGIYGVLSVFLIAWQVWIWHLDRKFHGPPILQVRNTFCACFQLASFQDCHAGLSVSMPSVKFML